jgi:hypothetical protein
MEDHLHHRRASRDVSRLGNALVATRVSDADDSGGLVTGTGPSGLELFKVATKA